MNQKKYIYIYVKLLLVFFIVLAQIFNPMSKNPTTYLSGQGETNKASSNVRPEVIGTLGVGVLLVIFFGIFNCF